MSINDITYTAVNIGGQALGDEYFVWLGANGGVGNTISDREYSMLKSLGGTPGSINDMWEDVLILQGYSGTVSDMKYDFFAAGGTFSVVNITTDAGENLTTDLLEQLTT